MEVIGIKFEVVIPWRKIISFLLSLVIFRYTFTVNASAKDDQAVQDRISSGFYGFEQSIDVSEFALTPTELLHIFSCVIKDDPYLFFVSRNLRYSYKTNGCVLSLSPQYTMAREEYDSAITYCVKSVRAIATLSEHFESEVQKALFLHDFICENFEYDDELKNDDIYDFLLTGRGTCEAYMLLYTAVLRECGIESHFAASDSLTHIWNIVRLDGEWYHVDLTWDDSASSETVSRRHFLCSDKAVSERGHRDWYSPINSECLSEKYDNYEFDVLFRNNVTLGDVDHDGELTLLDLLMIRTWHTSEEVLDFCRSCADLNLDGRSDAEDTELLRRKLISSD
ncbi:MAG: hypothetical protein IKJ07_09335 [Clostridia bacterium]|nr:hypothetical protein [Clostridia bacterium]